MENSNLFKQDAKTIVDTLFESRVLHPNITRDEMMGLEELISFSMKSRFDGIKKAEELFNKINSKKQNPSQ